MKNITEEVVVKREGEAGLGDMELEDFFKNGSNLSTFKCPRSSYIIDLKSCLIQKPLAEVPDWFNSKSENIYQGF